MFNASKDRDAGADERAERSHRSGDDGLLDEAADNRNPKGDPVEGIVPRFRQAEQFQQQIDTLNGKSGMKYQ